MLSGSSICCRELHALNAESGIDCRLEGRFTSLNELHPENTEYPRFVIDSGSVISCRPMQLRNALCPICRSVSGNVMLPNA